MSDAAHRILVLGGSHQGRQVIDAIEADGTHEVVGILDRGLEVGSDVGGVPVLGGDHELARLALEREATGFVVAIGDNYARGTVLERCLAACPTLPAVTVVHPRAYVARDAMIGQGTIILAGSVVSNGCRIGRGVLLGTNSSIDHDCVIDHWVSLAPNAATGGDVRIGTATTLGVGAAVIHAVSVGAHTVVGAGAAVIADLPDHVVAVGVPARIVRARDEGEPYLRKR